jgi:hypothetical protein
LGRHPILRTVLADHPVTFHLTDRPQITVSVPAGWRARKREHFLLLTRDGRRVVVRPCPLERSERDMTGAHAMRRFGGNVPVRGGGCLRVTPKLGLRAELGTGAPAQKSDPAAEQLARDARRRTLDATRATGTAQARAGRFVVDSTWEWDLSTSYLHQRQVLRSPVSRVKDVTAEIVRLPGENHVRYGDGTTCWGYTDDARRDDALEPRLELSEWNAPPATKTAWRTAYGAPQPRPDGTTRVHWTGFVASGEAIIGPDGLLRSVSIEDHGQAVGRTEWNAVDVTFTSFPAALEPVRPAPHC